jgi:hypothetical protein
MNLYEAWLKACGTLKPQAQGDCGLYSFWYATVLLNQLDNSKPIVYPRKMEDPSHKQSMRSAAKQLVKSGQGEILSAREMSTVIGHFGYSCRTMTGTDNEWRRKFISGSLSSNHPVLFPYTKNVSGPVDAKTASGTGGKDFGSHWSLIIKEVGPLYVYLDPHYPNTPQVQTKEAIFKSNTNVDDQVYERMWVKLMSATKKVGTIAGQSSDPTNPGYNNKIYDIAQPGRGAQQLAGVLVAVY